MANPGASSISNGARPVPKVQNESRSAQRSTAGLWQTELFCLLAAAACLATVVGLLYAFDGHSLPNWPIGITLNAIVSLLSNIAVFALVVPVSASLAQLKWLRMRRPRPLMDFELIENAGRGPVGSLKLLLRRRGGNLACSGALLMIALLGVGPFIQQIIGTDTRVTQAGKATVPIATSYAIPEEVNGFLTADVDLRMKSAIMAGLLSSNDSFNQFDVPSTCTSGNCTWPIFTSLAACSTCADLRNKLSKRVVRSNKTSDISSVVYELPNGVSLSTTEGQLGVQMTLTNTYRSSKFHSVVFGPEHNNTIVNAFAIALDNRGPSSTDSSVNGPYAAECIVEMCAQSYSALTYNGSFLEDRAGQAIPIRNYGAVPGASRKPAYWAKNDHTIYQVDFNTMKAFSQYFPDLIHGKVSFSNGLNTQAQFPNDITQSIWHHMKHPPHTLDDLFGNVAQSMSRAIRTQPGSSTNSEGHALVQEVIIDVRWAWISLPVIVLLLILLFLLTVIIRVKQCRLEPWKESSIAILFHGLNLEADTRLNGLIRKDEMEEVAKSLLAKLCDDTGVHFLEQVDRVE